MRPELLYALGTLSYWLGWLLALRGLYLLTKLWSKVKASPSQAHMRGLLISGAFSAVAFAIAYSMPMELGRPREPGLHIPIVWFVMPWTAWMVALCTVMAVIGIGQTILALNSEERRGRIKSSAVWAIFGMIFLWFYSRSEIPIEVLRGTVSTSPAIIVGFVVLAFATMAAMALTANAVTGRRKSKAVATHLALLAGSIVFGLPFAWLLVTSFKEDRDMASPEGLVWVPQVSQTVEYMDEENPLIEAQLEDKTVYGYIIETYADGSCKIEVDRPGVLRGRTTVAHAPLKMVPKQIPLVVFDQEGTETIGKVIKDNPDGTRTIVITSPPSMAGQTVSRIQTEVEPFRKIGLRLQNYSDALDFLPLETNRGLVYVKNTLILVIFSVLGTLLSSSIVAYAFARLKFPGKNFLFALLLSTMMLPAAVTLLPQFLIFRSLGWIDTLYPLWVPAFFGSAFNIFLLRQFFMGIPTELEDAAKIDGCSYLKSFWRVMLPQIKPALAVIAIWTFMGAWNNFMGPLVYINSPEKMPIAYAIQLFQGDRSGEPGLLMAFAAMGMLPVLALFFGAQKYFIEGVTLSGLGGR
ncbi:MAG: carbohydrate ABC transporter permease [Fimbriimonadaceae bacterium]|nr:carbohydrate ABC transporter permease [Fimbriimonadaceae bacterium]